MSCDAIARKFSANPMERPGSGIAFHFFHLGATGSGLYTHIIINHWIRLPVERHITLGETVFSSQGNLQRQLIAKGRFPAVIPATEGSISFLPERESGWHVT